jgi:hypothetical protein
MHTRPKAFATKIINEEQAKHIMLQCILILLKY